MPGPGNSRARAAAAPAHPSGRGPGPSRGPAPSPAGGPGRRSGARRSTARGKATKDGRRARPTRDGGPGPGTRAPGRAPPPDPGEGRATGQGRGRPPTHTSHGHLPGTDHRAALGRTHAPNRATPRGERTGLPDDADNARDTRLRGEGRSRPGKRGAPRDGGASTRCGRAGREKTRLRARQAAKRGGGGRRGTPPAQPTAARTHAGVSPPAASEHKGGPAWHLQRPTRPSAIPAAPPPPPQSHAARAPPEPTFPRTRRKADPSPPATHRAPTRGAADPVPKARTMGTRTPGQAVAGGDAPTRRSRVRAQTEQPTA